MEISEIDKIEVSTANMEFLEVSTVEAETN